MLAKSVAKSFIKKANKEKKPDVKQSQQNAPQNEVNEIESKEQPKPKSGTVIEDLLKYQGLFKKAEKLYQEEETKFNDYQEKQRDVSYFYTMLKKGTASDQISALNMLIQKNPTRSLVHLHKLVNLAKKKNRKQAESAFFALRDLFSNHILEDGVKLNAF